MNPERWQEIQDVLADAEARPEAERAAFLDERCGDDMELRAEVEDLLDASTEAAGYFDALSDRVRTRFDATSTRREEDSGTWLGRVLGDFRVIGALGRGGMGEVYRATDLRLGRDVALKRLPDRLFEDRDQVARLKREARILASLNHPNIAQIYGLEELEGRQVLVLELVDGPTLAQKMSGGRIPLEEGLQIAKGIAEALEAAHEVGVVHRDLKPQNVKLGSREQVKVLDFGIAKTMRALAAEITGAATGSDSVEPTGEGMIRGTLSYMSPEQLKGRTVDARSDIWAFGALLFEVLAGSKPFVGDTFADTIARILEHAPDWSTLPRDLPPRLVALLERCLERDPRRRLQAIGEARIVVDDVLAGRPDLPTAALGAVGAPAGTTSTVWRAAARVLGATTVGLGLTMAWLLSRDAPLPPVERFPSPLRGDQSPVLYGVSSFSLSPDGSTLLYRGVGEGGTGNRLWSRRWDDLEAVPLPGTERGAAPSVSYDGRDLAFTQDGSVKVMSMAGGPSRTLVSAINPRWGPDGTLYVTVETGVARIDPAGGELDPLTERVDPEGNHYLIDILPGASVGLMSVEQPGSSSEIRAVDLTDGTMRHLVEGGWPMYAESGHMVYLHEGSLNAIRFDERSMSVSGPSVPVEQGVLAYSMSRDGTLVYSVGGGATRNRLQLTWMDRSGRPTPVEAGWWFDGGGANPGWSLSPDGERIAVRVGTTAGLDIWVKELSGGTFTRLTFETGEERKPVWSPDGERVTFLSETLGDLDVWSKRADGEGEAELLYDHPSRVAEVEWSPDGRWLVLRTAGIQDLVGGRDIWAVRLDPGPEAIPLLTADHDESAPALSPDGRWLAYGSDETGRYEVYVRPFPDVSTGQWQVSTFGGAAPIWAHNGRELFYLDASRWLTAVEVTTDPGFRVMRTQRLFEVPAGYDLAQVAPLYDVEPGDNRFLMARTYGSGPQSAQSTPQLIVVKNFPTELRTLDAGR